MAAVPGIAVMGTILFGVHEDSRPDLGVTSPADRGHPEKLSPGFVRLLAAVVLFALGNSADAFLLLRLSQAGVSVSWVALLWSAHHVVKMLATYALGRLSDRRGRRPLVLAGWIFYAAVYAGFAFSSQPAALIALFLAYGLYFGLTEPVERAWAADLSSQGMRGRSYGLYHGAVGMAALPASLLFGLLWTAFGAPAAFLTGAALALAAALVLLGVPEAKRASA